MVLPYNPPLTLSYDLFLTSVTVDLSVMLFFAEMLLPAARFVSGDPYLSDFIPCSTKYPFYIMMYPNG